jgi:PadR family transcriptional regulator PadR
VKQTQLLKGVLEGCVLAIIKEKTIYGYELVQALREAGFTDMVGGTVYPLLQKLEKQEAIVGMVKASPDGPNRKYYSLTSLGEERLLEFQEQWDYLTTHVDQILTNTNKEF